jgi:nucleotide-binding universal stress UspA family protein
MKKIIIPTDFSEVASFAENAALSLATRMGAEAVFLSSIKGEEYGEFFEITSENVPMKLKDGYEAFLSRRSSSDAPYRVLYTHDKVTDAIHNYEADNDVALIVMGSSGTYGWKQLWGSNAQKVTREANCPVIIVKSEVPSTNFNSILFASDFRNEARKPYKKLLDFAELFSSHIHLAFVTTIETEPVESYLANKKMNAFKDNSNELEVTTHMLGDVNAKLGIEHYAHEHDIDIVAMISHQDGFFQRLVRGGSVSETLVNRLEKPIIVLPAVSKN